MKRRTLLKSLAAASAASFAGQLWAAPASKTRLLFVFMRGGYDATSLLVPISSQYYYEVRPNIAIARTAVLPLDADWGLHPALRDTIHPLFTAGQAAFVPFAGTEDMIAPRQYEKARHCFTAAYEIVQVPGGHFMHREHPSEFNRELGRVLEEHRER